MVYFIHCGYFCVVLIITQLRVLCAVLMFKFVGLDPAALVAEIHCMLVV